MTEIAFLHTAAVHQPAFADLMARLGPEIGTHHFVDAALLAEAAAAGAITEGVRRRMAERLRAAAATGAGLVVCTCSSVGGAAEEVGAELGTRVLRIDRPMAERAVAAGDRILVAAAAASTVAPTTALLRQVAKEAGKAPDIQTIVIEGAWERFQAGDRAAYHEMIAEGLRKGLGDADVVVLAQASMAPAAALCDDLGAPVLNSPELGIRRAVELAAKLKGEARNLG